MPTRNLSYRL